MCTGLIWASRIFFLLGYIGMRACDIRNYQQLQHLWLLQLNYLFATFALINYLPNQRGWGLGAKYASVNFYYQKRVCPPWIFGREFSVLITIVPTVNFQLCGVNFHSPNVNFWFRCGNFYRNHNKKDKTQVLSLMITYYNLNPFTPR